MLSRESASSKGWSSIRSDAVEYVLIISLFNNVPILEDSSIIETSLCPADTIDEAKLYPSVLNP